MAVQIVTRPDRSRANCTGLQLIPGNPGIEKTRLRRAGSLRACRFCGAPSAVVDHKSFPQFP